MADNAGLFILVAAALALMHSRVQVTTAAAPPGVPNAQREVDLSRWRHDGTQPLFWTKGNGGSQVDETASIVQSMVN